ncbi:MAG: hypothetical protein ACKOCK_02440 [Chloroflexota bacterium]
MGFIKVAVITLIALAVLFFGYTRLGGELPGNLNKATADAPASAEDLKDPAKQFSRALDTATEQAREVLRLGETKSRNLPEFIKEQGQMSNQFAEIDAIIAAGNLPPSMQPAVDAYQKGAKDIREAMDKAKSGLTSLDFDKVKKATQQLKEGVQSLSEAVRLAKQQLP